MKTNIVEAFAGQPYAQVTHTLILTNNSSQVWFKEIGWEFAVKPGMDAEAIFGNLRLRHHFQIVSKTKSHERKRPRQYLSHWKEMSLQHS